MGVWLDWKPVVLKAVTRNRQFTANFGEIMEKIKEIIMEKLVHLERLENIEDRGL